jgi:DNA repair protein RadC
VLYLNTKSELITEETVFIGTINQTLIHPREIFKTAIKLSASSVIFVHNHPTGDATPSKADLLATDNLMQASEVMGIDIIDHIIIGKHEFYSIKEGRKVHM